MSPEHVSREWLRCREWLLPAMLDATEDDVLMDLLGNQAQLWRGDEAAVVTRLITPNQLHIWLGGGSLPRLVDLIPGLIAWGRQQGCEWVTVKGRKGWSRVLGGLDIEERDGSLWKAL